MILIADTLGISLLFLGVYCFFYRRRRKKELTLEKRLLLNYFSSFQTNRQ